MKLSLLSKVKNSKFYFLFLAFATGIIMWIAWPPRPLGFLTFIGFVPLLQLESAISKGNYKRKALLFFAYTYLALVLWNLLTTWWIYFASSGGMVAAVLLNSLLMTLPFILYRFTKKHSNYKLGYISFVFYWLAFEYLHLNWEISWTWLNLGNSFATIYETVQWYEYTGVLGGTLWVLFGSIFIDWVISNPVKAKREKIRNIGFAVVLFLGPVLWSLGIMWSYDFEKNETIPVVIAQPNIDPYTQKFEGAKESLSTNEQMNLLRKLSIPQIDTNVRYVIWPETALGYEYWCEETHQTSKLNRDKKIMALRWFLLQYPKLSIVTGVETWELCEDQENPPILAKTHPELGRFENYNAALQINQNRLQAYYKSKLVPGVEMIPYPDVFTWLVENLDLKQAGNYGRQEERTVFYNDDSVGVAPIICYESVYGEFVGEFVKNGADFITIITNDGWWKDTDGYRQHNDYARLRAIENRRSIVRSANTGISCFINPLGQITQRTKYNTIAAMREDVILNDELTFYTKHGDYIGRTAVFLALLIFISAIVRKVTKNKV